MTLIAWVKLFLPYIVDYIKEVVVPGSENKKTTGVERICILIIIILFAILGFLTDKFFKVHDEKLALNLDLAKAQVRVETLQQTNAELKANMSLLMASDSKPSKPAPVTYDGQRTRTVIKTVPATTPKVSSSSRRRMLESINK